VPICPVEFRGRVIQINNKDIVIKPLDGPLLGEEGFDTVRLHSKEFVVGIDWQYSDWSNGSNVSRKSDKPSQVTLVPKCTIPTRVELDSAPKDKLSARKQKPLHEERELVQANAKRTLRVPKRKREVMQQEEEENMIPNKKRKCVENSEELNTNLTSMDVDNGISIDVSANTNVNENDEKIPDEHNSKNSNLKSKDSLTKNESRHINTKINETNTMGDYNSGQTKQKHKKK